MTTDIGKVVTTFIEHRNDQYWNFYRVLLPEYGSNGGIYKILV